MSSTTNTTIEEKDEAFFSEKGIVKFDDYFYSRPKDGIISGIDNNVFISSNTFGFETLQCKEFKPNQFAILGLLDTLKEFWNLGVSLGELAAKEAEQQTNTEETNEQLASKTEKLKQNAIKAKNKITKLTAAGYLALLYTLNGHNREKAGTDELAGTTHSGFITGEKRQHVVDELKRLDLFYDFPHFFYENLVNGIYGRTFQLPLIDYNSYVESSSDGQFTVGNFAMNGVKAALDKLIGETAQMGLPTGITWTKNDSYKTVGYTIKLYNSTIEKLITNIDFINNIVAGNMWAQNNVFLSPASLYDVKIPSRHTRLYYCTGSFACNYEGKVRLLGQPNVMWKPIANIYPKGVDRDKLYQNLTGLKNTLNEVKEKHNKTMALLNEAKALKLEKSTGLLETGQIRNIIQKIKVGFASLDEQYEIIESVAEVKDEVWKELNKQICNFYSTTLLDSLTQIKNCLTTIINKFSKYKKIIKVASSVEGEEAESQTVAKYDQSTGKVIKTTEPTGTSTAAQPAQYKASNEETDAIKKAKDLLPTINNLIERAKDFIVITARPISNQSMNITNQSEKNVRDAQETGWFTSKKEFASALSFSEIQDALNDFNSVCKDARDMANSSDYVDASKFKENETFTRYDGKTRTTSLKEEEAAIISDENRVAKSSEATVKKAEDAVKQAQENINKAVVTLTPSLTHIPDIFNLNVKFTSLLPNNFNTYLYSIENCNVDLYSMSNNKNPKLAKFVKTFGTNYVDILSSDTALTNASYEIIKNIITPDAERAAALAVEHIIPTIHKAYDGYDVKNDEIYKQYYAKQLDLYTYFYTTEYEEKNPTKLENYSLLIDKELELFSNKENVNAFVANFGFDSDSPGQMMNQAEKAIESEKKNAKKELGEANDMDYMKQESKAPTTNDVNA